MYLRIRGPIANISVTRGSVQQLVVLVVSVAACVPIPETKSGVVTLRLKYYINKKAEISGF